MQVGGVHRWPRGFRQLRCATPMFACPPEFCHVEPVHSATATCNQLLQQGPRPWVHQERKGAQGQGRRPHCVRTPPFWPPTPLSAFACTCSPASKPLCARSPPCVDLSIAPHATAFTRASPGRCVSVNDSFVMKAWADSLGAGDELVFLSDGNGDFTKVGIDRAAGCLVSPSPCGACAYPNSQSKPWCNVRARVGLHGHPRMCAHTCMRARALALRKPRNSAL
jgi:hypothetical protein